MANTLVSVYDRFDDAEKARNELLHCGFTPTCINLSSNQDEAGPVEGNFTVGDHLPHQGGIKGMFRGLIGEDLSYENNYASVVQRGNYVLTVDIDDESQANQASDILQRCGARDIDQRLPEKRL